MEVVEFKVGDRVVETGGGEFVGTVTSTFFPYVFVSYDDSPSALPSRLYWDMVRKLTPLEEALE